MPRFSGLSLIIVYQERILILQLRFGLPKSKISTPQATCQALVYFRGFRWRSLYVVQTICSQIFPFRIHGLGTWITSWMFLTFIASICWNLVSAPLSLEVQSWGRSWSFFILLTLANMTALGHYSRQAEGDRKMMGQLLVHSQRLGSFVWVSSCLLVSCLCFLLRLAHMG